MIQLTRLFLPFIIGLASIVGIADLIHACVDSSSGAIRIVIDSDSCDEEETLLEWNSSGDDLTALQEQVTSLQAEVDALKALLVGVSREGATLRITAANLQVVSGSGTTNGDPNGLGNIIIGYNELRGDETDDRNGSHMLVVGQENNYTSFGGIVVGIHNETSNGFASVTGGFTNVANGIAATVSGGTGNVASGSYASVTGGSINIASGEAASVSGGRNNGASGLYAAVSGGRSNIASVEAASVSGGVENTASGLNAAVSGGASNTASGIYAVVSGGASNTGSGNWAVVSGGSGGEAVADHDWVAGDLFEED